MLRKAIYACIYSFVISLALCSLMIANLFFNQGIMQEKVAALEDVVFNNGIYMKIAKEAMDG